MIRAVIFSDGGIIKISFVIGDQGCEVGLKQYGFLWEVYRLFLKDFESRTDCMKTEHCNRLESGLAGKFRALSTLQAASSSSAQSFWGSYHPPRPVTF